MPLTLDTRTRLPDALRVLLEQYPRDTWEAHGNFGQLIRFWLERHLMFRKINAHLREGAEAFLDRKVEADAFGPHTAHLGQMMLGELHTHHTMEDTHYFPVLARQDKRLLRGFEMLDTDHHALDGHLAAFAQDTNAALRAPGPDAVGALHSRLIAFEGVLNRHLTDEEELIVPVLLHYDPAEFRA